MASAQARLSNDDTLWLWANLIIERDTLPAGVQRRAFDIGFIEGQTLLQLSMHPVGRGLIGQTDMRGAHPGELRNSGRLR